jgi:crotonobetaine/carnitine-CoA ligase
MGDIIGNTTVRDIWESAVRTSANRPFLVFEDAKSIITEYTYAAFEAHINQSANLFTSQGISKGERVIIHLGNTPVFLMSLLGLAKIGAVAVPVSINSTEHEVRQQVADCDANWAIVESSFTDMYLTIKGTGDQELSGIFVTGNLSDELSTFPDVIRFDSLRLQQNSELDFEVTLCTEDMVEILFTSGTTSKPKGVMISHGNMVFSGIYTAWQVALRSDDRLLTAMPACHSNFQLAALTPVIVAGACLVMIECFSARKFWKQIICHRATVTQMISMVVRTLMLQPPDPNDRKSLLREILYFMPISDEEKKAFEERFGVRLMNTYGSTESIGWVLTDPPHGERRWPSVGRPGLGYEVAICDADGNSVPVGEIRIKGTLGRNLMLGYYKNPELTAQTITEDGWLLTGDQGYCDADGWYYFIDRQKNIIKRSGKNLLAIRTETY